jgi:hypothetical protein
VIVRGLEWGNDPPTIKGSLGHWIVASAVQPKNAAELALPMRREVD